MFNILSATTNAGKAGEIEKILISHFPGLKVLTLKEAGITDISPESGETFLENSVEKSLFYSRLRPEMLILGDDSGLEADSLQGRPGINSARFAGEDSNDEKNIIKLLHEMEGKENRTARFISVVTLSKNGSVLRSFSGEVNGILIKEKRGYNGFGYDPVFFYPPLGKTFAELSSEEKNRVSHRAKALYQLRDYLWGNRKDLI
ncbi:MAG: RdgB/HAM1 family non-canonical purine NTP pyrophosphatase [Acidobacteriota bacterium]